LRRALCNGFAQQFDMNWSGTLGSMPATAFNELVTGISDLRFNNGTIDGIEFSATTRNGMSQGTVRPRRRGGHLCRWFAPGHAGRVLAASEH
jgi:hypothetical protein